MDIQNAVVALGALAQETRLQVFRLLVQAGEEGLAVGRIAELLGTGIGLKVGLLTSIPWIATVIMLYAVTRYADRKGQQTRFAAYRQGGAHGGEKLGSEEDKQERQEGDV